MYYIPLVSTIFGLIAAIGWGSGDFLATKATRRYTPEATALWVSLISIVLYAAIFLFYPGHIAWDIKGILFAASSGICMELGFFSFFKGLDIGPISVVSPISSAYPLITTLIFILIFKGSLSALDLFGIATIIVGVTATSGIFSIKQKMQKQTRGIIFAFTTLFLWGIAYALLGRAVPMIGWQKALLIDMCAGFIALVTTITIIKGRGEVISGLKASLFKDPLLRSTAVIQLIAGVVFSIGLQHSRSSAVITAVSSTYPALTVFLAIKHLDEKKQFWPIFGALITIGGVILLSI